jgi:hypothetical protein
MELPIMIFDEVKRIEELTLKDSIVTFHISFHFHDKKQYDIHLRPDPKQENARIIEYKDLQFVCNNKTEYNDVIHYITSQIEREVYDAVDFDITWDNYRSEEDEEFGWYTIDIMQIDKIIFRQLFTSNSKPLSSTIKEHSQAVYHVYFPKHNYKKYAVC